MCLENIGRDQCVCAQTKQRCSVTLVTVVLAGIAGFYVTYGQMMKIISRNWLRFRVKDAIWFVDSLEDVKDNEDETVYFTEEVKDNVDKTHGFTLDRKAVIDDVFLIVFKAHHKNQFTRLVEFLEYLANEIRAESPFIMTDEKLEEMIWSGSE